jgi:hypothetical protein
MKTIIVSIAFATGIAIAVKNKETVNQYNPYIGYNEKIQDTSLNMFGYPKAVQPSEKQVSMNTVETAK